MANIVINDIFDELREENNRLCNENKRISKLLLKYRKFSLNFQNACICDQKLNNGLVMKALEEEYQKIRNSPEFVCTADDKSFGMSIEMVENNPQNESIGERIKTKTRKYETKNSKKKKNKKKKIKTSDIFSELSDENFNQLNEYSDEELGAMDFEESMADNSPVCDNRQNEAQIQTESQSKTVPNKQSTPSVKRFQCDECPKRFASKTELRAHETMTHLDSSGSDYSLLICEQCDQPFEDEDELIRHKKNHKKNREYPKKVFKCNYCDWDNKSKMLYWVQHLEKHHSSESPFKCEKCEFSSKTYSELKQHVVIHPKYECQECHKIFPQSTSLSIHLKMIHSANPTLYNCDLCGFRTKYPMSLTKHIERCHPTQPIERTFICDYEGCDKSFKTNSVLRNHKQVHYEVKIPCDWPGCDQVYRCKSSLNEHRLTHLGTKNFKCDYEGCPKSFKSKKLRRNHYKFHEHPYSCSWPGCEHTFGCKDLMAAHMNKHQNIRPWVCNFEGCGNKGFYSEHNLRKHRKVIHKL